MQSSKSEILSVAAVGWAVATIMFLSAGMQASAQEQPAVITNGTESAGEPLPDPLQTNATIFRGEIGSIQSAHQQVFSWSTAGDWVMELDGPLVGRAEPQIESFNATIHMVRLDGNILHKHLITNFTQNSVSHTGDAVTSFNGTVTVTMREGTVHGVPSYIQFAGDLISIWIDPRELDNHFGPTPIHGMVLPEDEVMVH